MTQKKRNKGSVRRTPPINKTKTVQNEEKLDELSQSPSSSDYETSNQDISTQRPSKPGKTVKKVRTVAENAMEEDFALPPPGSSASTLVPPSSPKNSVPVSAAGSSPNTVDPGHIGNPVNVSQHAKKGASHSSNEIAPLSTPGGSSPNKASGHDVSNKETPDKSASEPRADDNSIMDTSVVSPTSDDVAKIFASTSLSDLT